MIDSHCHLADKKFADDLASVLERARDAGVSSLVTIGDSLPESEACVRIATEFPNVFCAIGVHPHHAKEWKDGDGERLRALAASSKKVRAIGEIGLDYHYDFSPREIQRRVFASQLTVAKDLKLPVVVHCREAIEDVRAIVAEIRLPKIVLHCCTERWADVAPLVEQGHLLSFTGIVTYPNAGDVIETVRQCPLERMMIETDAPYLAPVPHRGKRNEPAFVIEVARAIAAIKGISLEEVDAVTSRNAVEFFGLP